MCPFFLTRILSNPSFFGSKVVADKIYPNFRNLKICRWSALLLQIRKEKIGKTNQIKCHSKGKGFFTFSPKYENIFYRSLCSFRSLLFRELWGKFLNPITSYINLQTADGHEKHCTRKVQIHGFDGWKNKSVEWIWNTFGT